MPGYKGNGLAVPLFPLLTAANPPHRTTAAAKFEMVFSTRSIHRQHLYRYILLGNEKLDTWRMQPLITQLIDFLGINYYAPAFFRHPKESQDPVPRKLYSLTDRQKRLTRRAPWYSKLPARPDQNRIRKTGLSISSRIMPVFPARTSWSMAQTMDVRRWSPSCSSRMAVLPAPMFAATTYGRASTIT